MNSQKHKSVQSYEGGKRWKIPARLPKAKQNPRYKTYGPHKGYLWHNTPQQCHWCKEPFAEFADATVDHVLPLSRGGTNEVSNMVLSCHKCNVRRSDYMTEITGKVSEKNMRRFTTKMVKVRHPMNGKEVVTEVSRKCRSCGAAWVDHQQANDCCPYGRLGPRK